MKTEDSCLYFFMKTFMQISTTFKGKKIRSCSSQVQKPLTIKIRQKIKGIFSNLKSVPDELFLKAFSNSFLEEKK